MKVTPPIQVMYERCAGLDIHKKTVVVCVLITLANGMVEKVLRTFSTMTADLLALDEWLHSLGVHNIALESTGVYWHPVYNLLEDGRDIILVNPQHMKAVPGRKTDAKDSEWLADLLRLGLLKASFIPPSPIRELRELVRYRKTLVAERAQEINRLQKVLEGTNIKLASVATDILGKSGRAMIEALIGGEQDAQALSELARGRLRAKLPDLRLALEGRVRPHQQFLLKQILAHIEFLEQSIFDVQQEIDQRLPSFEEILLLLERLPCVQRTAATAIISEIGIDMSRFPTHKHLASWAGVCPGNKQSGGKRLSGATTSGNPYLRAILSEIACCISRCKEPNYFTALFHRIARRRGRQRAIIAVAHSLLVSIYYIIRDKKDYQDLGADYFDKLDTARIEQHHVRRLEQLGYTVTLTPREAA